METQLAGYKSKKRSKRRLKFKAYKETRAEDISLPKFNTQKLRDQAKKDILTATIRKKAETLINTSEKTNVEKHWKNLKAIWSQTCMEILGRKKKPDYQWLSTDTLRLIEERRMVKQKIT